MVSVTIEPTPITTQHTEFLIRMEIRKVLRQFGEPTLIILPIDMFAALGYPMEFLGYKVQQGDKFDVVSKTV